MTFDVEYLYFFDETNMVVSSETKANYNQGDELMKLLDEAINDIEFHVEGDPTVTTNQSSAPVEGESIESPTCKDCDTESTPCEKPNVDT